MPLRARDDDDDQQQQQQQPLHHSNTNPAHTAVCPCAMCRKKSKNYQQDEEIYGAHTHAQTGRPTNTPEHTALIRAHTGFGGGSSLMHTRRSYTDDDERRVCAQYTRASRWVRGWLYKNESDIKCDQIHARTQHRMCCHCQCVRIHSSFCCCCFSQRAPIASSSRSSSSTNNKISFIFSCTSSRVVSVDLNCLVK